MDPDNQDFDYLFKLVLIGDSAVGKSNILSRYVHDRFKIDSATTIGVEFTTKNIQVETNGKVSNVKLQIWDTAGQERYRSITNAYYRGATGCLLVFDVTKRSSFEHTLDWLNELKSHSNGDTKVILIGNKIDLRHLREVTSEEAGAFCKDHSLTYVETSAQSGHNIEDAFVGLVTEIIEDMESKTGSAGAKKDFVLGDTAAVGVVDVSKAPVKTKDKKCC